MKTPLLLASLLLAAACAPQTSGSKDAPSAASPSAKVTADGGSAQTARGNSIALPAGALAVGTEVTILEVAAPTEFTADGASAAVEVTAKDAAGALIDRVGDNAAPATIALSIDGASLTLADRTVDNLCVLLKTHANALYVWRRADLSVDALKVQVSSYFFGTFQVVYCGAEPLPSFADSSVQKQVLASTPVTPNAAAASGSLALKVPAGFFAQFDFGTACLALLGERDGADRGSGSGSGSGDAPVILAAAPAFAGSNTAEVNLNLTVPDLTGFAKTYVGLTFHAAGTTCPLAAGVSTKDRDLGEPVAAYFWVVDKTQLTGAFVGTVGDAAGPFKTGVATVAVGTGKLQGFTAFDVDKVCITSDFDDGAMTLQRAAISTSSGSALIHGAAQYKMIQALPATAGTNALTVRLGETCNSFDPTGSDGTKFGEPYAVTFHGSGDNGSFQLAPTTLELSRENQLTSGMNGCLQICPQGNACGPQQGDPSTLWGAVTLKLNNSSYKLYLPFLTTPQDATGTPLYDLTVKTLPAGASCRDASGSTAGDIPLKGKALAKTIEVSLGGQ